MLGMRSGDARDAGAVKKRTSVATNSEAIAAALSRAQCDGRHRHVPLVAGRAKACERYPVDFCRLVCESYLRQVALDTAQNGERHVGGVFDGDAVDVSSFLAPLVARELEAEEAGRVGACWAFAGGDVEGELGASLLEGSDSQSAWFGGCVSQSPQWCSGWVGGVGKGSPHQEAARSGVSVEPACAGGTGGSSAVGTGGTVGSQGKVSGDMNSTH